MTAPADEGSGGRWRTIDSAPQNNVDVLVVMNHGQGDMLIARTPGTGQWWTNTLEKIRTPTHWMPLPPPPQGESV